MLPTFTVDTFKNNVPTQIGGTQGKAIAAFASTMGVGLKTLLDAGVDLTSPQMVLALNQLHLAQNAINIGVVAQPIGNR